MEGGRSFVSLELPLLVDDNDASREKALSMVGGTETLGRAVGRGGALPED